MPTSNSDSVTPERTSASAHGQYIGGRVIASGDGLAWRDLFVEVFSHKHVEQPFLVPAVAEPLIVWVMSGKARVDERDPGGEWLSSHVSVGDFFLTRTPSPYEMRWKRTATRHFRSCISTLPSRFLNGLRLRCWAKPAPPRDCGTYPAPGMKLCLDPRPCALGIPARRRSKPPLYPGPCPKPRSASCTNLCG